MRINNNLMAMNTHRQLGLNQNAGSKSIEKLSSGFRINRAGDDAAGLAISEKMRGQIRGLNQASRNAQDGISLIQTGEGALNETHAILQRMRELAVQSSTDTNTDADRTELQKEITQLQTEITRIADNTEFNTKTLLDGSLAQDLTGTLTNATAVSSVTYKSGTLVDADTVAVTQQVTHAAESGAGANDGAFVDIDVTVGATAVTFTAAEIADGTLSKDVVDGDNTFTVTIDAAVAATAGNGAAATTTADSLAYDDNGVIFHIGANSGQNISLGFNDMTASGLAVDTVNIGTQAGADTAITTINNALEKVSSERSKLGAAQNRLEHTIKNLDTSSENLQASESRVRDVDMAKEMMEFTKNNILQQAAQAMLAQANQAPQGVLQLLR